MGIFCIWQTKCARYVCSLSRSVIPLMVHIFVCLSLFLSLYLALSFYSVCLFLDGIMYFLWRKSRVSSKLLVCAYASSIFHCLDYIYLHLGVCTLLWNFCIYIRMMKKVLFGTTHSFFPVYFFAWNAIKKPIDK